MSSIQEIESYLSSDTPIPSASVVEWIKSDDLEVLGLVSQILINSYDRLQGELPLMETGQFWTRYYKRCIVENPQGKYAASRYLAAHGLGSLYRWNSKNKVYPENVQASWKNLITELYLKGDEGIRDAIICGILEHLFCERIYQEEFSDWMKNPLLKDGYMKALSYARLLNRLQK